MAKGNVHRAIQRRERQGDRILRMLGNQCVSIMKRCQDETRCPTKPELASIDLFLKKTHPNLKAVDHTGEIDNTLEIVIKTE